MDRAPQRIAVALDDHWACALLCAELRERGVLARCVGRLAPALLMPPEEELSGTRLVLADARALRGRDVDVLRALRAVDGDPEVVLLAAADAAVPAGPWDRVLRRPVTLGSLADRTREMVAAETGRPAENGSPDIVLRTGSPWPAAWCGRCHAQRHCQLPKESGARGRARIALAQFVLEHRGCGGDE